MSAADDSDPSGRRAPRDASRLSEDALDVARFIQPHLGWIVLWGVCVALDNHEARFDPNSREDIAAAERVLVERGLGEDLVEALMVEVDHAPAIEVAGRHRIVRLTLDWVAAVAFAPLDARLRAMARVVREKQPKEKA